MINSGAAFLPLLVDGLGAALTQAIASGEPNLIEVVVASGYEHAS